MPISKFKLNVQQHPPCIDLNHDPHHHDFHQYLRIDHFLSEYASYEAKALVKANLGIKDTVSWGEIKGNIKDQIDIWTLVKKFITEEDLRDILKSYASKQELDYAITDITHTYEKYVENAITSLEEKLHNPEDYDFITNESLEKILEDYTVADNIYTKDQVYNKEEVYNIDLVYKKSEVYNKNEVYNNDSFNESVKNLIKDFLKSDGEGSSDSDDMFEYFVSKTDYNNKITEFEERISRLESNPTVPENPTNTGSGIIHVNSKENLNSLEYESGTLIFVETEDCYFWKNNDGEWKRLTSSSSIINPDGTILGIPVLTKSQIEEIGKENLDKYIVIDDDSEPIELDSTFSDMLNAIKTLLAEVNKLKLSLMLGVSSLLDGKYIDQYSSNEAIEPVLNDIEEPNQSENNNDNQIDNSTNNGDSEYEDLTEVINPKEYEDILKGYYDIGRISIRTVSTYNVIRGLRSVGALGSGELIFVRDSKNLYINDPDSGLVAIGASTGPNPDENHDNEQGENNNYMNKNNIIQLLKNLGIINETVDEHGFPDLKINEISELDFINFRNKDTQKHFKFTTDAYGNLTSVEINKNNTILERLKNKDIKDQSIRGLIGQIGFSDYKLNVNSNAPITSDIKLYSDRVKIGAIYAPLSTDTIYGCSHAYIELENTSDRDWQLDGVSLYYCNGNDVYNLPLSGTLKAGSTYLVRGKKYAEPSDSNVYVSVHTYDLEWYANGDLIDLTIPNDNTVVKYALIYTPLLPSNFNITKDTNMYHKLSSSESSLDLPYNKDKSDYSYDNWFIDSRCFTAGTQGESDWALNSFKVKSNSIIKTTFELDPAKQAFQALTCYDSSRYRNDKASDVQCLQLNSEYITFPHSDLMYSVSSYTPRASYEGKNISTDKTKLNVSGPNMVTCSFGLNPYTTRTFNWISAGYFDEYVWIRKDDGHWEEFESYKANVNPDESSTFPRRKKFENPIKSTIYDRIVGRFPGDNTFYTSHKCIIDIVETPVNEPKTYTYRVGRKDINGDLDVEYCSEDMTFTLYPSDYTPRIYQTTDQQGFHWIEYQVWSAAAKKLNSYINNDIANAEKTFPVLLNTGDMTQNGTRINEWLDYYNGGECLFNHLEQVNCVGNNDLCGTDFTKLGTGDDDGKSNSYYFNVFYCYEVNPDNAPIITGSDDVPRLIPSLYYIDFDKYRLVMVNSELTEVTCRDWFKLVKNNKTFNAYTGWEITDLNEAEYYNDNFTSIYTMLYKMLDINNKLIIIGMHEMPFTVITIENILTEGNLRNIDRSTSGSSLVGSHMNKISTRDGHSNYWFTRLLEYMNKRNGHKIKLVLGGHKHTYSCTYPLREYFFFTKENAVYNSKDNYSEYEMEETLKNDNVYWKASEAYTSVGQNVPENFDTIKDDHLSKFPLTKCESLGLSETSIFLPYTSDPDLENGIIYFMCQATGYKLTSNKELPTKFQAFSEFVPKTVYTNNKSTAAKSQQYPMFGLVTLNETSNEVYLVSLWNIMKNGKFDQHTFETGEVKCKYFDTENYNHYSNTTETGSDATLYWVDTKQPIKNIEL